MRSLSLLALIAISAVLGALRVGGATNQMYQAAAHLHVGGLIGAAFVPGSHRRLCAVLAVGLSVLEVLCFLLMRRSA